MSTLEEIKVAITHLTPREKALLTAELFALSDEPEPTALEKSLQRGLADVETGRVHEVPEVRRLVDQWTTES